MDGRVGGEENWQVRLSEFPSNRGAGTGAYAGDDGKGGAGGCHSGG